MPTLSATVTASVPVDGVVTLTYTDTSTGLTNVVSRTLNIYNSLSVVVDTVEMGGTTATYAISADAYYQFTETIVADDGPYEIDVNFLSTAFYDYTFPPLVSAILSEVDVSGQIYNLTRAELYKNSAITFGSFGQGVNAQSNIELANFYLLTPFYVQ